MPLGLRRFPLSGNAQICDFCDFCVTITYHLCDNKKTVISEKMMYWSMEIQQIEHYVEDLLTVSGFREDGAEHHLWVLLRHLYSAVAMFEHLSDEDKEIVASTQKKLRYFFETKCNLKERKGKKREKEETPPDSLLEEKEKIKRKEQKTTHTPKKKFWASIEERREAFRKKCFEYEDEYNSAFIDDFYNWFSETSEDGKTMRFEGERYFSVKNRLTKWKFNGVSSEKEVAAARAEFVKKKQSEKAEAVEKQQVVAELREQANAEREAEIERSKAGAVSYEEWQRLRGKI